VAKQKYYGLRAHVRVAWPGVIVGVSVAPANLHDTVGAEELLAEVQGWALGDRNDWKPDLREQLWQQGLALLALFRVAKTEPYRGPRWLVAKRYRIETVFGQLVERFQIKRVWAWDVWHLTSRWWRKKLRHALAVLFCQQQGVDPLTFAGLVTD